MNKKLLIIVLSTMLVIIIIMKGWDWKVKHDEEQAYFNVQKKRVTLYMKYNLKEYKSITFTKTGTGPMGTKILEGYVNGNKNMDFFASAYYDNNFDFTGDISSSGELSEAFKRPKKTVTQIEEELEKKESKNNGLE
ncbi:DUF1433 domain-containing protein [Staphylococcus simulans]